MEIIYIFNSKSKDELMKSINLKNIKYISIKEYYERKDQFNDKDYLFIIDQNLIKENEINEIKNKKRPESIILLSETLDWDKLIDTFEKGETYYVKPIKEDDFKDLI